MQTGLQVSQCYQGTQLELLKAKCYLFRLGHRGAMFPGTLLVSSKVAFSRLSRVIKSVYRLKYTEYKFYF